tara:strand:+ start:1497 stop:2462 length:966 start_codon:yes stop_codon:yes gene_type:complete
VKNKEDTKDLILIVDALNLFTRHFIAHPALGSNGQHVGGIVGFLYALVKHSEEFNPTKIVVVWEGGGSKRKRDLYKDYKQKRRPAKLNRSYNEIPDTVENRNHQISTLIKILSFTPIVQIYVPDCEADDVIGYISKYKFQNSRKVIVSSDKDFYQLLNSKTIIYSPTWKKLVTHKEVIEKFNISPENFCLAKAVCGDPADNIPGVKGVGFKTLSKRFPAFKERESMLVSELSNICEIMVSEGSNIKAISNIAESKDMILRNWKLIHLDTANLAPVQIKSIHEIIDTFIPTRNKIMTMKSLISEGIQTFNVDRLFLSLTKLR